MRKSITKEQVVDIKKKIEEYLINHEEGGTVKEIWETVPECTTRTVSTYLMALVDEGTVTRRKVTGRLGTPYAYFWYKESAEKHTKAEEDAPFTGVRMNPDDVIPCGEFCNQGDIVYCSSRNGGGLYYRYLVLAVHPSKATCINVFPEGHKAINLNDPNIIFLALDPEYSIPLYADLSNVCQRRFTSFGNRCCHVSKETMDGVKAQLARIFRMEDTSETQNKFLADRINKLMKECDDLRLTNATLCKREEELMAENEELRDNYNKLLDDKAYEVMDYRIKEASKSNENTATKTEDTDYIQDLEKTAAIRETKVDMLLGFKNDLMNIIFAMTDSNKETIVYGREEERETPHGEVDEEEKST